MSHFVSCARCDQPKRRGLPCPHCNPIIKRILHEPSDGEAIPPSVQGVADVLVDNAGPLPRRPRPFDDIDCTVAVEWAERILTENERH